MGYHMSILSTPTPEKKLENEILKTLIKQNLFWQGADLKKKHSLALKFQFFVFSYVLINCL